METHKAILDHFELCELESIATEWHRIDEEIKANPHAYDNNAVTEEFSGYIDRDIDLDDCTFTVTTNTTTGLTYIMSGITIWKEDFSLDAIDIDEIEQVIKNKKYETSRVQAHSPCER